MPPRIFTDDDLRSLLTPQLAVTAMLEALAAHGRGELAAPPRVTADLTADLGSDGGRLVFTAGATPAHFGYRSYDTRRLPEFEQVVVAHSATTGAVEALAIGNLIGPRRTGGLGGAAASLLAGPGPHAIAVIGSGVQARNQLWAITGVLDVVEVRVHSPRAHRRERLAQHARAHFDVEARAVASAEEAVSGASIVILATTASAPVLDTAWLAPDVLVHTLGTKTQNASEIPADLLGQAFVVSDSPGQHLAEDGPLFPPAGPEAVLALGQVAAGAMAAPTSGRRVYLSCGLAGTEVALLAALASASA
ncbi:ectoine utilization protein EutC [Brevibacterium daeguense]|uniref:Ectoine utilization protein EutC n=1 Tax=Brevibacterium daeguense TaxID=909936 RepID=A0ABP8EIB6_9MICO|nr:hypothetical protein [Brevibacterium daeguense]